MYDRYDIDMGMLFKREREINNNALIDRVQKCTQT